MKKILSLTLILFSITMNSQINRYFKATPSRGFQSLSYEEMARVPMMLQKRYNENQKYLYNLQKLILKIKPNINGEEYKKELDIQFSYLEELEDADLARATKLLNQIDINIQRIVSNYKSASQKTNYHSKGSRPKLSINNKKELHGEYYVYNYTAVYDDPYLDNNIIKYLQDDEPIYIIEKNKYTNYYKIRIDGNEGFINGNFIKN